MRADAATWLRSAPEVQQFRLARPVISPGGGLAGDEGRGVRWLVCRANSRQVRPMIPWLSLVGIGEDGRDGLGPAARAALDGAALVVGGSRHLELAAPLRAERLTWRSPIESTFPTILARRGAPVCVLASGDPFCFGIGSVLARHVAPGEVRCWPAPSAFSLLAARLGWALQDCGCITLHGRPLVRIVPLLRPGARLMALSWDGETPAALAAHLAAHGFGPSRLTVGEALGGPRERVRTVTAAGFALDGIDPLNTIAIEVVAEPGARVVPRAPGLPDDWFEHDGQITKARVRAITIAALAPRPGGLLWDVGAGSGSVGIEWMLADPANRTLAIEKDPGRAARIGRNAGQLGVPDLRVVEGSAPAALAGLPPPDAIFIGGGVTAPGLLDRCAELLPTGGRLVANAVTVEGQGVLGDALAARGGDLVTIALSQAEPVGRFHGWRSAMPVVQWSWTKP